MIAAVEASPPPQTDKDVTGRQPAGQTVCKDAHLFLHSQALFTEVPMRNYRQTLLLERHQKMASSMVGAKILSDFHQRMEERIAEHKGWYALQASALIAAGILAMVLPIATPFAFEVVTGVVLAISGAVKGYTSFKSQTHWWSFLSAAVSFLIGALMLWQPVPGVIALATLVAVFLLAEGLTEIFLALEFESARNWGWLLVSGVVSVVLSVVLFVGWPGMTVAFLGFVVGVNLLLYGASIVALLLATPDYDTL
jgi:uncharacterized membrane protein HdeD (DUF308 family)